MNLADICSRIELILSDVDGVMTDGGIHILDDGQQLVKFHIRDGMAVRMWREAGKRFGIVTGRRQVCYIGDDLLDLPTIRAVGLGVAVADAVEDVRHAAKYVTSVPGGRAAVREVIELVLKNTGRWEEVIRRYGG